VKIELDDRERRAVEKSLSDRKARLVENIQDTTRHRNARRAGTIEAAAIASVLRKLRAPGEMNRGDKGLSK
jgi:hypothetical protein